MNERTIIKLIVGLMVTTAIFATGNPDIIYLLSAVLFFALCIAYAEWCERL